MTREERQQLLHRLAAEKLTQEQIARILEISQERVSQLLAKPADATFGKWGGHKTPRMSQEDGAKLVAYMEQPPSFYGYEYACWSSRAVLLLIQEKFGITYHMSKIPELLRRFGLTLQRPRVHDNRQKPEKVKEFLEQELPALKKKL